MIELDNKSNWQTTAYPIAFTNAVITNYLTLNTPQNGYTASGMPNRWNAYCRAYVPGSESTKLNACFLAIGY